METAEQVVMEEPVVEQVAEETTVEQTDTEEVVAKEEQPVEKNTKNFKAIEVAAKMDRKLRQQRKEIESLTNSEEYKAFVAAKEAKTGLGALKALGFDLDQLTQEVMNGGVPKEPTELDLIKSELEEVKKFKQAEEQARLQKEREALRQEEQNLINSFFEEVKQEVSEDKYPLIAGLGAQQDVFNAIVAHAEQTGKILDINEAAAEIEKQIADVVSKGYNLIHRDKKESDTDLDEETDTNEADTSDFIGSLTNSLAAPSKGLSNSKVDSKEDTDRAYKEWEKQWLSQLKI